MSPLINQDHMTNKKKKTATGPQIRVIRKQSRVIQIYLRIYLTIFHFQIELAFKKYASELNVLSASQFPTHPRESAVGTDRFPDSHVTQIESSSISLCHVHHIKQSHDTSKQGRKDDRLSFRTV